MFAIGITGINLSATQRYFDISLTNRRTIKYANGTKLKVRDRVTL